MSSEAKNFKIPSSFVLFGNKYEVKFCDNLYEEEACYGTADENKKLIRLQSKSKIFDICKIVNISEETREVKEYFNLTDEKVVETFYHELVHIIFDSMGEESLSENEKLVNMIAKALLEIYLSSEYEAVSKVS